MDLSTQKTGYVGVVKELSGDEAFVRRLLELGVVRGETVVVRQIAIFGEPLFVEVRGALLALRKKEATCIQLL